MTSNYCISFTTDGMSLFFFLCQQLALYCSRWLDDVTRRLFHTHVPGSEALHQRSSQPPVSIAPAVSSLYCHEAHEAVQRLAISATGNWWRITRLQLHALTHIRTNWPGTGACKSISAWQHRLLIRSRDASSVTLSSIANKIVLKSS